MEDVDDLQGDPNITAPPEMPYFIPRRPQVIKMRDLPPEVQELLTREYFDAYDPWTGVRIAATLGLLISLFTFFLIYKSKFHRRNSYRPPPLTTKDKTSVYLYEEDSGSMSSGRSSYGLSFTEDFQLEEVYVKSSSVVVVKKNSSGAKGPQLGTMAVTDPRSLPCSPYRDAQSSSEGGSIASFEEEEVEEKRVHPPASSSTKPAVCSKHGKTKKHKAKMVVLAKRPLDYRSRSTIVSIARRQRMSS